MAQPWELTAREKQVWALLAKGHRDNEIAALLGIERRTVESHIHRLYSKLALDESCTWHKRVRAAHLYWRAHVIELKMVH